MEIYKNDEWRKRIVSEGSKMVAQGDFWLFGTATYCDGTTISRNKAEKDARYFFNKLDRALLKRIDYIEGRKLERLVFIETGRTRTNMHMHFFIKGNDYISYIELKEKCIELWPGKSKKSSGGKPTGRIKKAFSMILKDNLNAGNSIDKYCWKEMNNLNADVLHVECCHINLTSLV